MKTFEIGKSYYMTSACNSDARWTFQVVSRTAKTVTLIGNDPYAPERFKISVYDGTEQVKPFGNYSMCPILKAEREVI